MRPGAPAAAANGVDSFVKASAAEASLQERAAAWRRSARPCALRLPRRQRRRRDTVGRPRQGTRARRRGASAAASTWPSPQLRRRASGVVTVAGIAPLPILRAGGAAGGLLGRARPSPKRMWAPRRRRSRASRAADRRSRTTPSRCSRPCSCCAGGRDCRRLAPTWRASSAMARRWRPRR